MKFNTLYSQTFQVIDNDFNNEQLNLVDVNYIALGEALHGMAGTHHIKTKNVKLLHEKYGYNVLAFESPMYDMTLLDDTLRKNKSLNAEFISKNISGVWSKKDMYDLFDYIISTYKTKSPLRITGFDESFFNSESFITDFKLFTNRLNNELNEKVQLDSTLINALTFTIDNCFYFKKVPVNDTLVIYQKFSEMNIALDKVQKNDYFIYWRRMINNLTSVYRKNYSIGSREKEMFRNSVYLTEHKFKNEKIIFWGATYHLMTNKKAINKHNDMPDEWNKNMGNLLKNRYKDAFLSIAFTPYIGHFGFKGYLGLLKTKVRTKKGSLEYYINKVYDADFVFVDLRVAEVRKEIVENDIKKSNIVWSTGLRYKGEVMEVNRAVDAIFYYKKEYLTPL